jgi:uncharacterized protein (TIGR02099 family)
VVLAADGGSLSGKTMLHRILHAGWLLLVAVLFLTAVAITIARLWVPELENYRHDIEVAASTALQHEVSIGDMQATWRGINPVLRLKDVVISGDGGYRLVIREVRITLDSRRYLSEREIGPSGFDVIGVELSLVRDAAGRFSLEHFGGGVATDLSDLFTMSRLSLHDASITLTDRQTGALPQRFSGVVLSLKNSGYRHRLTGYAMLPDTLGKRVDIEAEFYGHASHFREWQGRAYLKAQTIALPALLEQHPLGNVSIGGIGDFRLWADISSIRLAALHTEFDIHDFSVGQHNTADSHRFSADNLRGQLGLQRTAEGWKFALQQLAIESAGRSWESGHLAGAVGQVEDRRYLNAASELIDLNSLGDLLPAIPGLDATIRNRLLQLQPRGYVRDLRISLEQQGETTRLRRLAARFSGLGCEQSGTIPKISGLDGTVSGTFGAGTVTLKSRKAKIGDTRLFRGVLPIETADGQISWSRTSQRLELASEALRVTNRDLALMARFALDLPADGATAINLELDLEHASLDRVSYYLPARVMPASGVAWLDQSLRAGVITDGTVRVMGRLDQLPFDQGEGVLEVRLPVTQARLDFHPGWSSITDLDAQVNFTGRAMEITSHGGMIRSARIERVSASIPDLARPDLQILGDVRGSLDVMLAELGSSPLGETYGGLVDRASTSGAAGLGLDIRVSLYDDAMPVEVSGTIDLDGNDLRLPDADVILQSISGQLAFDNNGVTGQGLTARLFGKPARVKVWNEPRNSTVHVQLDGPFGLLDRFGGESDLLHTVISGNSDWRILLSVHGMVARDKPADIGLTVSSSLAGTTVKLPAPFGKERAAVRPLSFSIDNVEASEKVVRVAYGDRLQGLLKLGAGTEGLQLQRGTITVGDASPELPDSQALLVAGQLDRLNTDEWAPFMGAGAATPVLPLSFDLHIDEVEVAGWRFPDVTLDTPSEGPARNIRVRGPAVAGSIQLQDSGGRLQRVVMNLDQLKLQPPEEDSSREPGHQGPADMPDLQITIGDLGYGKASLGKFEMLAQKQSDDLLAIKRLSLSSRALELNLTGDWKQADGQQSSSIDLAITDGDMEKLLGLFDYQKSIKNGKLTGSMQLAWAGAPWMFSPERATGKVRLSIKDGQLVDVKPGATGRVLGLLSVSSLPRRLTLDFSDLFADGFSFDTIEGSFLIDSGNAYTNDLVVNGPAARIEISGRVGLADKDYDQLVTVTPYIKSGLSLAGVLAGGPAVGAVMIVAETLLQDRLDPLNKLASKQYQVTGPWSDPVVTNLNAAEAGDGEADTGNNVTGSGNMATETRKGTAEFDFGE